jgi:hypothetical protein
VSDPENLDPAEADPAEAERRTLEGMAHAGQLTAALLQRLDTLNGHPPATPADVARTAAYRAAALKEANPPSETRRQQSGQA